MIKDFQNRIWVDTRTPFGGVAGCATFGWLADAWRDIIMTLLSIDKVFRWVDDNMFVKIEGSRLQMGDVIQISDELGVKSNHEKFCDFAYEQKYRRWWVD